VHYAKIRGKWGSTRLIQTTELGVKPSLGRIAHIDKKRVSSEYRLLHLITYHQWTDDDGAASIDEIMKYKGWQ
jgi:hypothetical protein